MRCKVFEVRDEGTHIGVFALSTEPAPGQEYELSRNGFASGDAVILGYLSGERESSADPYFWGGRTMPAAHNYITERFDELPDGAVVDVRHILGETEAPCESDRLYRWSA